MCRVRVRIVYLACRNVWIYTYFQLSKHSFSYTRSFLVQEAFPIYRSNNNDGSFHSDRAQAHHIHPLGLGYLDFLTSDDDLRLGSCHRVALYWVVPLLLGVGSPTKVDGGARLFVLRSSTLLAGQTHLNSLVEGGARLTTIVPSELTWVFEFQDPLQSRYLERIFIGWGEGRLVKFIGLILIDLTTNDDLIDFLVASYTTFIRWVFFDLWPHDFYSLSLTLYVGAWS